MNRDEIQTKVFSMISDYSPVKDAEPVMENDLREYYGIDSIVLVELLVNIETNFGITIESSDLSYEYFSTLKTIVDYIEKRLCNPVATSQ